MTIVRYDLEGSSLSEQAGEINSVTRVCVVAGITGYQNAGHAMQLALQTPAIPQPSEPLFSGSNVLVTSRSAKMFTWDASTNVCTVEVTINYELCRNETDNQYPLRGSSSLQQIETEKDADGEDLALDYKGHKYVGQITPSVVTSATSRETVESTNDPEGLKHAWAGSVNSAPWQGREPGSWLCTNVEYEPLDMSSDPRKYRFKFEFEHNPQKHEYWVVYRDESGRIPSDIEQYPEARKLAKWYPDKDFADKFV